VVLKVLKIFPNQFDHRSDLIMHKFAKEVLAWWYLKHPNIVPFVSADSITFPSPTMAMVSSWISQGDVLDYMAANSPASEFAISLLYDIIQGLMYLHSENIVHGDLCGVSTHRDCIHSTDTCPFLTDFGLASLIDSETTTHGGSRCWMGSELLLPHVYQPGLPFRRTLASDVWAFVCVCCEVCLAQYFFC
ncbi:kinase-like domain-containing protein, partial [Mycena maculata]